MQIVSTTPVLSAFWWIVGVLFIDFRLFLPFGVKVLFVRARYQSTAFRAQLFLAGADVLRVDEALPLPVPNFPLRSLLSQLQRFRKPMSTVAFG